MHKKKWRKPKLIVLVRGKKEERVLLQCKGPGASGLVGHNVHCIAGLAGACSALAAS